MICTKSQLVSWSWPGRRRGADNGRQHVRVAAADRVQGPLGEDDGDDAVERDDHRAAGRERRSPSAMTAVPRSLICRQADVEGAKYRPSRGSGDGLIEERISSCDVTERDHRAELAAGEADTRAFAA